MRLNAVAILNFFEVVLSKKAFLKLMCEVHVLRASCTIFEKISG